MGSIELCLDRARVSLPSEGDDALCSGYPLALARIIELAEDPDFVLMASRATLGALSGFRRMKSTVSKWAIRTDCCVGADQVCVLIRAVTDKCHCLDESRQAEILLDDNLADLPDGLNGFADLEREDLYRLAALSSLELNGQKPKSDEASAIVLTRLPCGSPVKEEVVVTGEVFCDDGRTFPRRVSSHCIFVGDPYDLMVHLEPKELWLSAGDNLNQLELALKIQVLQEAGKSRLTHARRWKFGCEFVSIASDYGYMSDGFRAGVLLKAMAAKVLEVPKKGDKKLNTDVKSQDSPRYRIHTDGSRDVGRHTRVIESDLRLNYWDCADGSIEFGAAMDHDDDQVLPEC